MAKVPKGEARRWAVAVGSLALQVACSQNEPAAPCPPVAAPAASAAPLRIQHRCELRGRELFLGDFETVEAGSPRRTAWHLSCGSSTCGFVKFLLDDTDPTTIRAGQLTGGEARVEAMDADVVKVVFGTKAEPEHLTVALRANTVRYRKDLSDGGVEAGEGTCVK